MNAERWQLVKDLVEMALKLPTEERHKFVVRACISDNDLKAEVESLIEYHQKANSFLETPAINNLVDELENKKTIPQSYNESSNKTLVYNSTDDEYRTRATINQNLQPGVLIDSFIGKTLDAQYEIEALLGSGGMGSVYRANHKLLKRQVAIKVMSSTITNDITYRQLFIREGRAATLFNHPNSVTIYDLRETDDGTVYLVLEYVQGHTLSEELKKRGSFSIEQACEVLIPIAEALAVAHKNGVVHRDLKPANIMVSHTANLQPVKLLDLGLAKIQRNSTTANTVGELTISQHVLGTPYYMSPEQWSKDKDLDGRADIYSLGIILYELIAGYKPFNGATIEILAYQHTVGMPTPLHKAIPGVPEHFSNVVLKAIAKDRSQRYSNCTEFVEELKKLLSKIKHNDPLATMPITQVIVPINHGSSSHTQTVEINKVFGNIVFQNKKLYGLVILTIILMIIMSKELLIKNYLIDFMSDINDKPKPKIILNLNGEWLAYGYCCGLGTEVEKIMVRHTGDYVVATKITGDEYVPAGNTTWEGKLTGNTSKVDARTADKGFTNPKWVQTTIQIISVDEIFLGKGFNIIFKRATKENIPTKTLSSQSISGLWGNSDDTGDSVYSVVDNGGEIKIFVITPSYTLKNTYKWNSGDLRMQARKTGTTIVGKYFTHAPTIEGNCPKQWIQSNDMELVIIGENTISGTRKAQKVNSDCSLGESTKQTFVLVRKSFNVAENSNKQ